MKITINIIKNTNKKPKKEYVEDTKISLKKKNTKG